VYISLNWIKDFVKLPEVTADNLANSFTMTTAEVEEVTSTNKHLVAIKVAQITTIRKHPDAEKLNLVTVDYGAKETKEVVCGASNVREGLVIPYAPLGVTLPNGLTLEPKKIRGVLSEGMLCSADELGHGEVTDGLLELKEGSVIGTPMIEYFNLEADTILDVDNKSLTHRPDLWGHYGLAREFSAAYETPLNDCFNSEWKTKIETSFNDTKSPITPKVDTGTSCKAYWGLSVDGIKVSESPTWLKDRLDAVGLRPINNIVDISNYVMMELGIPLHIFDRDLIEDDTIHIKSLGNDNTFETLDEVERKLIASDTVICDSKKPLVLAGIMGGMNSGVSDKTTKIFIEVANWEAVKVRTTSTRLGLRTDSSQRYEKSLDSLQCYKTLLRTLELVKELSTGATVVGKPEYDGDNLDDIETLVINTSAKKINRVLGYEVSDEKLNSIFTHLDFGVEKIDDNFQLTIPTYRTTKDIESEADIIEEVGRIIGYDNIIPTAPSSEIKTTRLVPAKTMQRKVQDFMVMQGRCLEVMTYPLIGKKLLEKARWPVANEALELINALSVDADRMRPSLVPHALNTAAINAKHFPKFSFFELGRSYLPDDKDFSNERHQLIIGMYNKSETPFIDLLNTTEKVLNYLEIPFDFTDQDGKFANGLIPRDWTGSHPHEYVNIRIMGKFQGAITTIHPLLLKNFKTKGNFSVAVIDFTDFENRPIKSKTKYAPIAKFPGSTFDCTVLMEKNVPSANAVEALKKVKIKELTSRKIVDVFNLNDEQKAVTLTVTFEDPNRTLDSEFIKKSEDEVVKVLADNGFHLKA